MPYVHSLARTIVFVALLFDEIPSNAQDKVDWYDIRTKTYQALPTSDIQKSSSKLALKISFTNYVLEISSGKDNQFQGHLILHTSSYQEGDYNGRFSQNYFTDHELSSDTARIIFDLFTREAIAQIPTDKEIAGWRYGVDGITYTIETNLSGQYSKKTYWTPSAFKEIKEAVVIDRFFSDIESILQLQAKWSSFSTALPRGNTYRYGSMMLFTINQSPTEQLQKIVLKYQKADEPPVVGGRPEYKMTFNLFQDQLVTASFSVGKDRVSLEDTLSCSPSLVKTITEWANDKKEFSLKDLGLTRGPVGDSTVAKKYGLTFPMPDDLVVEIDSLSICKNYSLKQVISTGGNHITVSIIYDNHEENFVFDNDNMLSDFDFKGYITCYAIFANVLTDEFPAYKFFSEETLYRLLYQYQKIVECEGYYYKEYTSKHPELSSRDRRMMKGWDFKKYLKETGRIN